jgi:hypothetical protein
MVHLSRRPFTSACSALVFVRHFEYIYCIRYPMDHLLLVAPRFIPPDSYSPFARSGIFAYCRGILSRASWRSTGGLMALGRPIFVLGTCFCIFVSEIWGAKRVCRGLGFCFSKPEIKEMLAYWRRCFVFLCCHLFVSGSTSTRHGRTLLSSWM